MNQYNLTKAINEAVERSSTDSTLTMTFVSYGLRIAVCSDDETILDRLVSHLPPGSSYEPTWKDSSLHEPEKNVDSVFSVTTKSAASGNRPQFRLFKDNLLLECFSDLDGMLEHFESNVGIFVAENALDHIFIHAGCVSWKGKAIIIPGRSFSGKSNLVAALLRAGATYYSDEYCILDGHGLVLPYPRCLSLRAKEGRRRMTAADFGAAVGSTGIPAGRFIYTRFEANAGNLVSLRPARVSCFC
jgi:hypothetical protein